VGSARCRYAVKCLIAASAPYATASQAGLTMTLSKARKIGDITGPALEVTFTADRALRVQGSPPTLFEVLYLSLRDSVIVGGGPMLKLEGTNSLIQAAKARARGYRSKKK
jgi:hypothetical protein